MPACAILGGSALSAGASGVSGLLGSSAASDAAKVQANAATQAAQVTKDIYTQIRTDMEPYRSAGQGALGQLRDYFTPGGYLNTPLDPVSPIETNFAPTQARLEATPGYQFTLTQGEKAATNALAAQGLGKSGAEGIALTKYAAGLADTTYQDQFSNWYNQQQLGLTNWLDTQNLKLAGKQQLYNQLAGLVTTGQSAAAGTASAGIQTGSTLATEIGAKGAATASGIVGSTNALTSGITGAGSAASNTGLLLALNNSGMFGGTSAAGSNALAGWGQGSAEF